MGDWLGWGNYFPFKFLTLGNLLWGSFPFPRYFELCLGIFGGKGSSQQRFLPKKRGIPLNFGEICANWGPLNFYKGGPHGGVKNLFGAPKIFPLFLQPQLFGGVKTQESGPTFGGRGAPNLSPGEFLRASKFQLGGSTHKLVFSTPPGGIYPFWGSL